MEPEVTTPQPEKQAPIETLPKKPVWQSKFLWGFMAVSFISAFIIGGLALGRNQSSSKKQTATTIPTSNPTVSKSSDIFLSIPEYGVKFSLSENIKDAYELPETASKGYIYLRVHSLDSESQCKTDPSSTAAIARQGKNDTPPFDLTYEEFKNRFSGAEIGNYYYYIDLAQYACAQSDEGKTLLEKVRKEFSAASKTITPL